MMMNEYPHVSKSFDATEFQLAEEGLFFYMPLMQSVDQK